MDYLGLRSRHFTGENMVLVKNSDQDHQNLTAEYVMQKFDFVYA